jgi:predicted HNH restriction endonuclease
MNDFSLTVEHIRDNPDGSGDFTFHVSDEDKNNIVRWAIIEVLKKAIEEGKKLDPSKDNLEDS